MELQQNFDRLKLFVDDGETPIDGYPPRQEVGVKPGDGLYRSYLAGANDSGTSQDTPRFQ